MLELLKQKLQNNREDIAFWCVLTAVLFLLYNGMIASAIFVTLFGIVFHKYLKGH